MHINYNIETKIFLQNYKTALPFSKADVGTNGGLGYYLSVLTSFLLKLQINPGFYIKTGNFNYWNGNVLHYIENCNITYISIKNQQINLFYLLTVTVVI